MTQKLGLIATHEFDIIPQMNCSNNGGLFIAIYIIRRNFERFSIFVMNFKGLTNKKKQFNLQK